MINKLMVFGLGESNWFASEVSQCIQFKTNYNYHTTNPRQNFLVGHNIYQAPNPLASHIEDRRPDGEAYVRSMENVRGADVYVISSIYGDTTESVDDKLMKLLIFINTLRHASAGRITVVAPYLPYMRQDRKTESRAPISTQAVAIMLESMGMDRLITMDVHNLGAEQNAFRGPIDNLEARKLLADKIVSDYHQKEYGTPCWTVVSPDAGGVGRTKLMQHSLEKRTGRPVHIVYADKTRIDANNVKVNIIGSVKHQNVIIVDDMISSGGTLKEICDAVEEQEGRVYAVCATHGLFVNGAPEKLKDIPRIYVADTIMQDLPSSLSNVRYVSTGEMFADAIMCAHGSGGSISSILED